VDAFEATRTRLEAQGEAPDAIWEALERLNLGRLRIASKGLRREGDALVPLSPEAVRDEGMVLLGQVAAPRRATPGLARLPREVSEGPSALLTAPEPAPARPADVAIVGMSAFFPGSDDLETFWSNLVRGHDAVTEVPPQRWSVDRYYDADAQGGDKSVSKWGG